MLSYQSLEYQLCCLLVALYHIFKLRRVIKARLSRQEEKSCNSIIIILVVLISINLYPTIRDKAVWFKEYTGPWGLCHSRAFTYAERDTGATFHLLNGGRCTTETREDIIHDALTGVVSYFRAHDVERACFTITHGDNWEAHIATSLTALPASHTSCNTKPWYLCKNNESGAVTCSVLQGIRDEL